MKTPTRVLNVDSTLQGEKIGMSIDESALSHIMSVLTDLYSDPEMAVIREYSTNALDSHVEAGVSLPIEVTLPSNLSPYFKIRDYGAGLNLDDIRETYSRYGTSTKRDTNDLVGTLGLGCKSALTYTNQFTLQGIKDGVCTQVAISRDEDGSGSMTIVAEYETDEASGVEITVPVNSYNEFEGKAGYLFQFWAPGTVLINGKTPEPLRTGLAIDDDLSVYDKSELSESVIVMGNVPYPVGDEYSYSNYTYVLNVEIGAVQFTPSREALQLTTATKQLIEDTKDRIEQGKQAAIEKLVSDAPNRVAALAASLAARTMFGYRDELTYRGEEIPQEFDCEEQKTGRYTTAPRLRGYRRGSGQEQVRRIPISAAQTSLFFTGYKNTKLTPTGRAKLDQWFAKQNFSDDFKADTYVLVEKLQHPKWVDKSRVVKWDTVWAEKLPPVSRGGGTVRADGRPTGSYDARIGGIGTHIQAEDIDMTVPLYWHKKSDGITGTTLRILGDAQIITVPGNRVDKFLRNFPHAVDAWEGARKIAQDWADGLRDVDVLWLQTNRSDLVSKLDRKQVDDPALRLHIRLNQTRRNDLSNDKDVYGAACTIREIEFANPFDNYPLFDGLASSYNFRYSVGVEAIDHIHIYLNAAYAAAKGGQ